MFQKRIDKQAKNKIIIIVIIFMCEFNTFRTRGGVLFPL